MIHTDNGVNLSGNIQIAESDLIGHDKITHGDEVHGDKFSGDQNIENQINHHYGFLQGSFLPIELSEYSEVILKAEELDKLQTFLKDHHIAVLRIHPRITPQTLAYHLAQKMHRTDDINLAFEWSGDGAHPDFHKMISPTNDLKMQKAGAYICSRVPPRILANIHFTELQQALKSRSQYLILITDIQHKDWELDKDKIKFWPYVPEDIYDEDYLHRELRSSINQLPTHILANIAPDKLFKESHTIQETVVELVSPTSTEPPTMQEAAVELGSPTNISVFIAHLEEQSRTSSAFTVHGLIKETVDLNFTKQIDTLFKQLTERQDQLLAVGLSLCGGLYEGQFFAALKKLVREPWKHIFQSVEIFDYFHLETIQKFFIFQNRRIDHRQSQHRILLLKIAWQSYRYHIIEALPEVNKLIIDSGQRTGERAKLDEERLQDSHLRFVLGDLLGQIGCLSPSVAEDALLRLASHHNWGVQATVARAIVTWCEQDEDGQARPLDMLTRWQKGNWRKLGKYEVIPKYVQLTIARTLSYLLATPFSKELPQELSDLTYEILFGSDDGARQYIHQSVWPKIVSTHLDPVIQSWSEKPQIELSLDIWMSGAIPLVYSCNKEERFDKIAPWFIKGSRYVTQNDNDFDFNKLDPDHKSWFFQQFTPRYLAQMEDILFSFVCNLDQGLEVVKGFSYVPHDQQMEIEQILENWRNQWQKDLNSPTEDKVDIWWPALPIIGLSYGLIGKPEYFENWLSDWKEAGTNNIYKMAEALVELQKQQLDPPYLAKPSDSHEPGEVSPAVEISMTSIERIMYNWLCNGEAKSQKLVLLFWGELQRASMAQDSNEKTLHKSSIRPYFIRPYPAKLRHTLQNLLPTGQAMRIVDSSIIDKVLTTWQNSRHIHAKQIAQIAIDLRNALRLHKFGFLRRFFLGVSSAIGWPKRVLIKGLKRFCKWIRRLE